ncbi:TonB-dependent receptor [Camelimonas fluminis]|uniref:TonB-dependent receptor n=1 Tax=Camelimonas fluminis TaxID=1576911 RepID=A0ABV7UGF3_9HYPH|nr:TonB-dependent siderophore receptor [Camelimonas fluminis]
MLRYFSAVTGLAMAGALAPHLALAEAQGENAAGVIALDTISVTGQGQPGPGLNLNTPTQAGSRLNLTPMETPASIDIISGQTIQDRGQTNVEQAITQNATGVTFIGEPGNGGTALSMRGFTGATSITRLYDGVRMYAGGGAITFPFDTWTVDRIDVLRGPASVLYGEGAIGGAINVIPKKPQFDKRRTEIMTSAGSFGMFGLGVSSNGPINDRVAYNIGLVTRGSRGWVEGDDTRSLAFSGAIAWKVNEDLQLTLSEDYGYNEPTAYYATPLVNGELLSSLRKRNYNVADNDLRFKDNLTQLHARWTPTDNVEVNSRTYYVSSYKNWRNVENYAWRPETRDIIRNDYIAIRHEFEQVGNRTDAKIRSNVFGMANETVVGFDVNHVDFKKYDNSPYPGSSIVPLFGGAPGFFGPYTIKQTIDATLDQYSLFVDNRLKLNEQIAIIGGVRYDSPHLRRDNPFTGDSLTKTLDSVNWRIGVVWTPVKDLAVYAQYSKASDPVASLISFTDAVKNFKLPQGQQIEGGLKATFLGGRGEATFSAYHIVKKDMLSRDPLDYNIVRQVGQQSSEGVEASIGFDLGHGLRIDANGVMLRARYDDFVQADGDYTGNTPANVPRRAANIWASWTFMDNWTVFGGLQYVGKTWANDANTMTRPAYTVVNAGLRWKPHEMMQLDFNVSNLFDTVYATSGAAHHELASSMWRLGPPRTASLTLRMTF